jgi:hypothetical protein
MAKKSKFIKFEVESESGTKTDISHYINQAQFEGLTDTTISWEETLKELYPSFWKHPIEWLRAWLARRRLRKVISGLPSIEITIGPLPKTRRWDWWKWN